MINISHTSSRTSNKFIDHVFTVTKVPMNNHNTIVMIEALNDNKSIYVDGGFDPKPDGSSYTISVRGLINDVHFADVEALQKYILVKLNLCSHKFEQQRN
jgi:hypothetical protein